MFTTQHPADGGTAEPASSSGASASSFPGTGSPFGATATPYGTGQPAAFSGWQAQNPAQSAAAAPTVPSSGTGKVSRPPWELTGPLPVISGTAEQLGQDLDVAGRPADFGTDEGDGASDGDGDGDFKGLPRRVRQASIAPQLRGEPTTRVGRSAAGGPAGSGGSGAGTLGAERDDGPSPSEIRATMSALQRGLKEGRSQRAAGGEPPWETEPAAEGETDGA